MINMFVVNVYEIINIKENKEIILSALDIYPEGICMMIEGKSDFTGENVKYKVTLVKDNNDNITYKDIITIKEGE